MSGVMIMEPVIAQIGGIVLDQDNIPGKYTLIGGLIITAAFLITGYGEKLKDARNEEIEQNNDIMHQDEQEMSML